MKTKTKEEFINNAHHVLFREYKSLKRNLRKVLEDSNLPDFYKTETLFELVEDIREEN